jgi:ribosomal protein S17E
MIISLAYKYIYILSRTIEETYFALKSRLAGNVKSKNIRNLISGWIFFILKKSRIIYENTYLAGKAKVTGLSTKPTIETL